MEAIKTPNDMSDNQKALTWLKENTRFKDDFYIELSQEAAAMFLQSYAEQHLEDVLGEAENDFKAIIYITLSNTKTIDINATLKNQLVKEIWNTTKEALNLLKQRKG